MFGSFLCLKWGLFRMKRCGNKQLCVFLFSSFLVISFSSWTFPSWLIAGQFYVIQFQMISVQMLLCRDMLLLFWAVLCPNGPNWKENILVILCFCPIIAWYCSLNGWNIIWTNFFFLILTQKCRPTIRLFSRFFAFFEGKSFWCLFVLKGYYSLILLLEETCVD